MKSEEFSKNIPSLDPAIRIAGLTGDQDILFSGSLREGISVRPNDKNSELSLLQSAHIVFLKEGFSQA